MSSPIAGFQGVFSINSVPMVQVFSVEITTDIDTYDVTKMSGTTDAQWKEFLQGILSWTLKVEGHYDLSGDAVQGTLWTNMISATPLAIRFSPNTGTNAFTGTAIIKQIPMKFPVDNKEDIAFTFQGSGPLSYS